MKALPLAFLLGLIALPARAWEPWLYLPPTPTLPSPDATGLAPVDGIKLWYAVFGASHPDTVLLLHGGLANSDYWGKLVPALARTYRVVVIDSRGHGRSSRNATPIGYELMAQDALALLDTLHIQRAAVVGLERRRHYRPGNRHPPPRAPDWTVRLRRQLRSQRR